ncbi:hypothetical protein GmHk_18G052490 [Glycine max]|nr:hypothetical protein GmHk_18G052490 [Glycine max]
MVKLICGIHNHELAKSLVEHPYAGRLTKNEKNIIVDMTKSMVKPRNILLTLKEHNANSCTTIKQIYNARSAYCSSIRGSDTEMQHLMKLLERDQYIHWHRLKDEFVVRDLFWCHPDAVKLCNACHLVFLINSTYKTNRYALNEIAVEFKRVHYAGKNPSSCGCVMRIMHSLPCACELSRYVVGSIPLDLVHMFWKRLSFSDQGLCEAGVTIKEEIETISKRFKELDVCGKVTLMSKLQEIAYPDQNSICPHPSKVNTKDGNYGYRSISALLGIGEDSWSLVHNQLDKELGKCSDDYINLFGGTERFEE